ncbi:Hypothetical_protein [Hexamita inflata]|uniref:Hypothetical_protein n=1 Tax=Hexamita inflata TaxID=28002 RepID=A0ABP1LLA0_9EUKA
MLLRVPAGVYVHDCHIKQVKSSRDYAYVVCSPLDDIYNQIQPLKFYFYTSSPSISPSVRFMPLNIQPIPFQPNIFQLNNLNSQKLQQQNLIQPALTQQNNSQQNNSQNNLQQRNISQNKLNTTQINKQNIQNTFDDISFFVSESQTSVYFKKLIEILQTPPKSLKAFKQNHQFDSIPNIGTVGAEVLQMYFGSVEELCKCLFKDNEKWKRFAFEQKETAKNVLKTFQ